MKTFMKHSFVHLFSFAFFKEWIGPEIGREHENEGEDERERSRGSVGQRRWLLLYLNNLSCKWKLKLDYVSSHHYVEALTVQRKFSVAQCAAMIRKQIASNIKECRDWKIPSWLWLNNIPGKNTHTKHPISKIMWLDTQCYIPNKYYDDIQ